LDEKVKKVHTTQNRIEMSWCCCCCGNPNKRHEIRTKENLREIKKLGGAGVLFEEFDDSGSLGTRQGVDESGRVPMLLLELDEDFGAISKEQALIEKCIEVIETIAKGRVAVVAIIEEFVYIGPIDVDYEKALKVIRRLARKLTDGLSIPGYEAFHSNRVNIRLFGDPDAPDPGESSLSASASQPLLSTRTSSQRVKSRSDRVCWLCCCFCCSSSANSNKPFVFDSWEKSEFGWFYTGIANETNGEEDLRKSVDRMVFTSDSMSWEQLGHLVDFFISYYFTSKDITDHRDEDSVSNFRGELLGYLKRYYKNDHAIDSEDVIKWFTREMPRHYCWRSTKLSPQKLSSCVIS